MKKPEGNPNMKEVGKKYYPPVTESGKFLRNFKNFSRDKVPEEILDLYDFCNSLNKKKVDYLLELKNLYSVLKSAVISKIYEKLSKGEILNHSELQHIKLLKEILTESHKLKYGDKKVIENIVTQADLIKHMRGIKTVEAKVVNDN